MKTILILLVPLFILCAGKVNAQSPAPEPDTLKEVKQTDPEAKNLPKNANYTKDQLRISSKQIPEGVRSALNSDTQYEGWEKGSFYKNEAGNLYTLEITKADTTRTYRFHASGKLVKE